jgi:hypothetical protein
MRRSKKIFVGVSVLFFAGLVYLGYDISSRTTFPGTKPQLPERIKARFLEKDTTALDTIPSVHR